MSKEAVAACWARIRGRLRGEFGDAAYRNWLKAMTLVEVRDSVVRIAAPTRFKRDWIHNHFGNRIRGLWQSEDPNVRDIEIIVMPERAGMDAGDDDDLGDRPVAATPEVTREPQPKAPIFTSGATVGDESEPVERVDDISARLDPRFTFDNFVVGKPNELAYAAARQVAESVSVRFNPLFLYGGVGLGKTHLMHAIAWQIRKRQPSRKVVYLSAEKFMYQFIRALRLRETVAFKEQFRAIDVLMVDDVQFFSGKDSTQEEFFHTFNALIDQNSQVVISADKSPNDLAGVEERVKSRLAWGLVADLHPTTYELRLGILQSKAEQVGATVPGNVLEFLAHRITSNVRELEGALTRLLAHADFVGRPITLDSAQDVLKDLLRANSRQVTIEEIQKRVAEHYNIKFGDMHSPRRARAVARPRQVAMYLAKALTSRSLPEIGRKFGGRDHTTVMHAVRKVEELRAGDVGFNEDVELLRRMIEG
jgi:chromosomal replication initiator protein